MVASEFGVPYDKLSTKDFTLQKTNNCANTAGIIMLNSFLMKSVKKILNGGSIISIEISKWPLCVENPSIVICSDGSMTGWDGVYENNSRGGRWSKDEGSYQTSCCVFDTSVFFIVQCVMYTYVHWLTTQLLWRM